jgi:hypothetical protein
LNAHVESQLPVVRMALLLAAMLAGGLLTSYVLFGSRAPSVPAPGPVPVAVPLVHPAAATVVAGAWVHGPDIKPIPATPAERRAASRALQSQRAK